MPHSHYLPEEMGTAEIAPAGSFEAGSYQSFTLTYTAGRFGMDDTASLKIVFRFAADMGRLQFDDPQAANYVTVEASNNAVLETRYDPKGNIRPWDKTLYIKVVKGFMKEGDRIVARFGDPRAGSPGLRLQTFCEPTFEFRVLVDAMATYNYVPLPESPTIAIVPGPAAAWKAVLPTMRRVGQPFRLGLKAEDRWGNPTDQVSAKVRLRSTLPVTNLPADVTFAHGRFSVSVDDLRMDETGDLTIEVLDEAGEVLAGSNPLRIVESAELLPYWGDLHGQTEETIGTNSVREYFAFARDRAFWISAGIRGMTSRSRMLSGKISTMRRESSMSRAASWRCLAMSGRETRPSAVTGTFFFGMRGGQSADPPMRFLTTCPTPPTIAIRPPICSRR